jgi:MFS family permease
MPANGSPAITPTAPTAPASAAPGAAAALTLLLLINLFNYIDRQVLAAVEPEIRRDLLRDPVQAASIVPLPAAPMVYGPLLTAAQLYPERLLNPDSKFWMGLLSTAFLVFFMLTAPIFGWLSNRVSRWLLVSIGVILWSLASGASGIAYFYLALLLTRCLVGVGEAVYGPVAPAVISDLYPVEHRGAKLAWFYLAIPVGGALGYALGAAVVLTTGDWRWAFYLVVPPGILLGIWCLFMPEPPRGHSTGAGSGDPAPAPARAEAGSGDPAPAPARAEAGSPDSAPVLKWRDYLILVKTPSFVLNTLGMTAMCFAMGGLAYWAPAYLEYRNVPTLFGIDSKIAFGALTALMGLAATLLGGLAGDWLKPRWSGSYFLVSGAAMVLAFPMILLVTFLPFPLAWLPLMAFVFFLFFNTGPTNTILANVTHPLLRAPGFAINILIIHLFGDAVSPPIMGAIADRNNLDMAFQVVSVTVLIGGLVWLWGARYLARDTELAPTRLGQTFPSVELPGNWQGGVPCNEVPSLPPPGDRNG